MLGMCTFMAAMLVFAPIELNAVRGVRHWQPVAAQFIEAGYKRSSFDDGEVYPYVRVRERSSGQEVEIRDVRPGDLPFKVAFLGLHVVDTSAAEMKSYVGRGDLTVWRSPGGRKYVLEQGSYGLMSGLFILSLLWWAGIALIVRRRGGINFASHLLKANA